MRILVWQWGRFGAGPRVAADFAALFNTLPGTDAALSLSSTAEILQGSHRPRCELPVATYRNMAGFLGRALTAPVLIPHLARRIAALQPDVAMCAMPGPLDLVMDAALRRVGVPYAVVVHDADPHPGDYRMGQMALQHRLLRRADAHVVLSTHVRARLVELGLTAGKTVLRTTLPPHTLDLPPPPPRAHGGKLRVLFFGRLLDYKGLDLLADALAMILPRPDIEVRIVGSGPESAYLKTLRGLPGVSVENRWVPEDEVGNLLAWSDAIVMTHREASQSGVAAAGLAARRWIVSTRIGGIAEQLQGQPGAILCDISARAIADGLLALLENPPEAADMAPPDWQKDAAQLAEDLQVKLVGGECAKGKARGFAP